MCVSKCLDVRIIRCYWRHNIISAVKILYSPQNEATRNLKIPVEHDERWGLEMMPTLYSGEWKRLEETKRKKGKLINCRILECD